MSDEEGFQRNREIEHIISKIFSAGEARLSDCGTVPVSVSIARILYYFSFYKEFCLENVYFV